MVFQIDTDGCPKLSAPLAVSKAFLMSFLQQSREEIAKIINEHQAKKLYLPGALIGKTHLLKLDFKAELTAPQLKIRPNFLVVSLPFGFKIEDQSVQAAIRPFVKKILQKDAKEILLPRLEFLARQHGFVYQKAKLSHASTCWGSCNSRETISINIGLAGLANELIDYVLIHELCHLRERNHSPKFWAEVERILPNYKQLRRELKQFSPHI